MDENNDIPKLDLTPISASRIKVFENCSWLYFSKYILKLPESTNAGASMGSVCHSIFELLLSPKHYKQYKLIIKSDSISGSPSVSRLTSIYIRKNNLLNSQIIFNLIDKMILVGLNSDFFVKGGTLVKPEYEFNVLNQNPLYLIKGFIDKPFIKGKKIIIDDFKSSKKKFEGEDITSNLQALIYSLAATKIWPELKPKVRFIFLQFPEDPITEVSFSPEQLRGLEHYLADIQKRLDSFNIDNAFSNLAANQGMPSNGEFKGRLLCGFAKKPGQLKKDGSKMWHCAFKFPFNYFAIVKDGKTLKTSMNKNDLFPKDGEEVEERMYEGCPAHRNVLNQMPDTEIRKVFENVLDDF